MLFHSWWVADTVSISQRFPELGQLETEEERQAVFKQALQKVGKRPRFWLYMILGTVVLPAGVYLVFSSVIRRIPMPRLLIAGLIGGIVAGSMAASWQFVFRSAIQEQIRLEMVARGVPVCMGCGYDLRGQVEPRCPECGRAFS